MPDTRESFNALIKETAQELYTFCCYLCGNHSDAEDLSQDVFVRAFKSVKDFQHKAAFSTWLHRIAINLYIDKTRRKKAVKFSALDDKREFPSNSTPEKEMENNELKELLKKSMDFLTPEQKSAIVLKYIENKSLEEIANICDTSIGTVSSRITRGIQEIRKHLKGTNK
ncbi:MAG: hypothetical protein A3J83_04270 [Elusimicrobia bacterium RIFOXYA2_FULL_40_6]|nr:MAG: hypothetical protein A3J83_04270 [Elusimicrobia bacterium RIFOXYA2_FULL_40_6]